MKTRLITPKANTLIKVNEDTQFVLDFSDIKNKKVDRSSEVAQYKVHLLFEKPGINAEIIGIYKLKKGEKVDLTTIADHRAPHTTCYTNVKGVLENETRSSYVGKILIGKKAQQTTSFLQDDILVIGENTENDSQPILEIEADDVKASHGATTGRVDATQIYYLMSRGLSERQAENLIVEGFFEPLLNKIADLGVKDKVKRNLV